MTDALRLARGFTLPLEVVTEATAIVATRGAGKSSASAVVVEEAFPLHVQAVVLDRTGVYWGLRSNAKGDGPGLGIYVLGGPHGDVPLETHSGVLIADLVVDSGHSFVLDLSDFSKSAAIKFAADFLDRLYDRKARARTTTLLVIDEAHFYAPQAPRGGFKGDAARLMGAMEDVVGLGRSRGIGVVLTTQRTQALNKAVLDLIETLLVMRMLSPRAREAVRAWLMEKQETDERGVIPSLDGLPTGTAWVWSPLRGILEKIALRRIKTFDSYATPKPGETRAEPTKRKQLDLAALGEQMAATAERAKENDPAELKRRLREAEAKLAAAAVEQPQPEPERVEVRVEVPVISDEDVEQLRTLVECVEKANELGVFAYTSLREVLYPLAMNVKNALHERDFPARHVHPDPPERPAPITPRPITPSAPERSADGNGKLNRRAERAVLAVLAQYPQGRTKAQLAILSGYAKNGGGFNGALSKLRTLKYIEGKDELRITDAGVEAIHGQWEPLPHGKELLDYWLSSMNRAAERAVLQAVYDVYPNAIDKEELAARTGYEASGGGFNGALSKLRTLELIERGEIRASAALFD